MTAADLTLLLKDLPDEAIHGLTLYGEARGEPIEGQIAVGCCIRNRVKDEKHRWGTSYRSVCLQPKQFSCWNDGPDANHAEVLRAASILLTHGEIPPLLSQCGWIALGVGSGELQDTVHGANHYHTVALSPRPPWAQGKTPVAQRGHHVFYLL